MLRFVSIFIISIAIAQPLFSQIQLPAIFSDSMVLQQQTQAAIWGTDKANTKIIVTGSWGKTSSTTTNNNGIWRLKIETPKAGGPFTVVVKGSTTITLTNVLIGEVWLCSGQSNMEMPIKGYANSNQAVIGSNEFILQSNNPSIRLFTLRHAINRYPSTEIKGNWQHPSPATTANFPATPYFFAKKLQAILGVPIGIIENAWGGANIESWLDSATLASYKKFVIKDSIVPTFKTAQSIPTFMHNAMLHPLIGYSIKGAIWYQGEGNRKYPHEYQSLFTLLINSWRQKWKQGNFPFYFVQIAPFGGNENTSGALVREAQLKTMQTVENTGMACIIDIGDSLAVHPPQKELVGNRLAYWALAKNYNIQGIAFSGPVYTSMEKTSNNRIIVSFDYANMGLNTFGKPLRDFEIAGEDKIFYPAQAIFTKDRNNCITVWNDSVKNPISVRYAFKNWVVGSLYNTLGLPASSFRTDNW